MYVCRTGAARGVADLRLLGDNSFRDGYIIVLASSSKIRSLIDYATVDKARKRACKHLRTKSILDAHKLTSTCSKYVGGKSFAIYYVYLCARGPLIYIRITRETHCRFILKYRFS